MLRIHGIEFPCHSEVVKVVCSFNFIFLRCWFHRYCRISRTGQLLEDCGEQEILNGDTPASEELPSYVKRCDDKKTRLYKKAPYLARDRHSEQWLNMSLKLKLSLFNTL